MSELLPCPFCGGEALIDRVDEGADYRPWYWWTAHCANRECVCADLCHEYETEAEAIEAWNTRYDTHIDEIPATEENMARYGWVRERACKQEERGWSTEGDHARVWLTCGHDCMVPTVQDLPNYCPNCGAKVVSE